jgi:hypothetical protein
VRERRASFGNLTTLNSTPNARDVSSNVRCILRFSAWMNEAVISPTLPTTVSREPSRQTRCHPCLFQVIYQISENGDLSSSTTPPNATPRIARDGDDNNNCNTRRQNMSVLTKSLLHNFHDNVQLRVVTLGSYTVPCFSPWQLFFIPCLDAALQIHARSNRKTSRPKVLC